MSRDEIVENFSDFIKKILQNLAIFFSLDQFTPLSLSCVCEVEI